MKGKRFATMLVVFFLVAMGLSAFVNPVEEARADDEYVSHYTQTTSGDSTTVYLNADRDHDDDPSHIGTGFETITSNLHIEFMEQQPIYEYHEIYDEWYQLGLAGHSVEITNYDMAEATDPIEDEERREFRITLFYQLSDKYSDYDESWADLDGLKTRILTSFDGSEDDKAGFIHRDHDDEFIGGTNVEELQSNIDLEEVYTEMAKDTAVAIAEEIIPGAGIASHAIDMASYLDPEKYAAEYESNERRDFVDRDMDYLTDLNFESQAGWEEDYNYIFFYETYELHIPQEVEEFTMDITMADNTPHPWYDSLYFASYSIDFEVSDCYDCLAGTCDCGDGNGGGGGGSPPGGGGGQWPTGDSSTEYATVVDDSKSSY